MACAIRNEVALVDATVLDPDPYCVENGQKAHKDIHFINGYFPDALKEEDVFDVISMQALFPQLPDWKNVLLALRKHARKYINLSLVLRLTGNTVVDKDVSYFYYFDSGERVHQVVHNIYELFNFLCVHEMGVKAINFYGYHTPNAGHNFRCVPNKEQVKGNLMIELFENEEDNPFRMGGACDKGQRCEGYEHFVPEMNIIIDDEKIELY